MTETDRSLAARVQAHLRAMGRPVPALPDLVPVMATGREELALKIAGNNLRRSELRTAFAISVSDGAADLTTQLADPSRLLLAALPQADVRDHTTGNRLYYLGRTRYDMVQPAQFGYYTFEGQMLYARLVGELPGVSAFTADVTANFVPASDEVPASCVPDLALIVVALMGATGESA